MYCEHTPASTVYCVCVFVQGAHVLLLLTVYSSTATASMTVVVHFRFQTQSCAWANSKQIGKMLGTVA